MAASSNPDILYYHEAMKAPDREKFLLAMKEEVRTHSEGKHWKVVPRASVPQDKRVLPSVWAMRRKRRLDTQEVYKWKARLNVHGGKQKLRSRLLGDLLTSCTVDNHSPFSNSFCTQGLEL